MSFWPRSSSSSCFSSQIDEGIVRRRFSRASRTRRFVSAPMLAGRMVRVVSFSERTVIEVHSQMLSGNLKNTRFRDGFWRFRCSRTGLRSFWTPEKMTHLVNGLPLRISLVSCLQFLIVSGISVIRLRLRSRSIKSVSWPISGGKTVISLSETSSTRRFRRCEKNCFGSSLMAFVARFRSSSLRNLERNGFERRLERADGLKQVRLLI